MQMNEFQKAALRTGNTEAPINMQILNYCLGLAGETGEYVDLLKKHMFHNHDITSEQIASELGDILWYVAMCAHVAGLSLEDVAQFNVDKLKARYPEKFNSADSIARVDTKLWTPQ